MAAFASFYQRVIDPGASQRLSSDRPLAGLGRCRRNTFRRGPLGASIATLGLTCAGTFNAQAANFTCSWNDATANWTTVADWSNCNGTDPNNVGGNTYDVTISTGDPDADYRGYNRVCDDQQPWRVDALGLRRSSRSNGNPDQLGDCRAIERRQLAYDGRWAGQHGFGQRRRTANFRHRRQLAGPRRSADQRRRRELRDRQYQPHRDKRSAGGEPEQRRDGQSGGHRRGGALRVDTGRRPDQHGYFSCRRRSAPLAAAR